MAFSRLYLFFLVLIPSVSNADACRPESRLCNLFVGKLSFIFTAISDLLIWVVLFFLGIIFVFFFFNKMVALLNQSYLDYKQRRQMGEMGEYVRLPDGSFVSQSKYMLGYSDKDYNFVNEWLDSETTTVVRFNNSEFDYKHRYMFDDPAIDYLGKEQPEIIGYNDEYFDDVWDRRAPIGNPEVYVSLNESEVEDEPFIRHISGIEGFIDSLLSGEKVEEEDFPYENFDDWREYDNFWRG